MKDDKKAILRNILRELIPGRFSKVEFGVTPIRSLALYQTKGDLWRMEISGRGHTLTGTEGLNMKRVLEENGVPFDG